MKRPSFQWYPNDWLSASEVRACSLAARGLWMDMICLMHQGIPYGYLTFGGKVYLQGYLEGMLARIVGADINEIKTLLEELEALKVFSRTEEGVIFCRRMVEDERLREIRASGGFKALNNPNVPKPKLDGLPSTTTNKDDHQGIPSTSTNKDDHQGIPSSSSSSSPSGSRSARGSPRSTRRPNVCDEEFLEELQTNPAYEGLDVRTLFHRMAAWCRVKGKEPTRARLVNWLNREDRPMKIPGNGALSPKREYCGDCNRGWLPAADGELYARQCPCVSEGE